VNRIAHLAFSLSVAVALPVAALAQQHGAPPSRSEPPSRPAPAVRPAPAPVVRSAPSGANGGFNFNHDLGANGGTPVHGSQPPGAGTTTARLPSQRRYTGPVVRNGHAPGNPWGWNHGVPWSPAPVYWGGGFWGPWALAGLPSAVYFGAIPEAQIVYPSYQVESDSPGAQLLQDYGLQQTSCGPPDLVVIWGPDNSVICALPNNNVGPGNYSVDPETFSLVSAPPP